MGKYERVAIVGVGLIGGSIGQALRMRGLASRVVGIGRNEARLAEAVKFGAVDETTTDPARGVAEADVAIVCTPVTGIADWVNLLAKHGSSELLVTDAGSTKRAIVEAVEHDERGRDVFVGGHPIAGSERQGVEFAVANLFEGRACAVTPTKRTPPDRLLRAREFWESIGCRVVEIDPVRHDEILALTSHLPHAVAAALAASVPSENLLLAAGAYRDGTRVAGADASLWAGIFLENRGPLLDALDRFQSQFDVFRRKLEAGDRDGLIEWWSEARSQRLKFDAGRKPGVED